MSQADASAEWLEGAHVGGLLFRCQCLSNRAACYLKSGKLGLCVDDAGAALAALGASPDDATKQLRLKLLARRGMCLCQLERCNNNDDDNNNNNHAPRARHQRQSAHHATTATAMAGTTTGARCRSHPCTRAYPIV